jgi:lipoprotein NlpI
VQFSEQLRSLDHGWTEKVKVGRGFQLHYSGEMDAFRVDDVLKYYDVDPKDIFINDAYEDPDMYDLEDGEYINEL